MEKSVEKDPAFLLYSKDWIQGTLTFSNEERGIYINLLCNQHQDNGLPNNTKLLARIVGMSESDFLPHWDILKSKFKLIGEKLFNPKLETVMDNRSDYSAKRKLTGYFGNLLKNSNLSDEEKIRVKSKFNILDYLEDFKLNEGRTKVRLKVDFNLIQGQPKGRLEDENEIGNEDLNKGVLNYEIWTLDILNKRDMYFDELVFNEEKIGGKIRTDRDIILAHEKRCIEEGTTFKTQDHFRKCLIGYLKSASKEERSKKTFIVTPKNN